jgi:hypothetical protein
MTENIFISGAVSNDPNYVEKFGKAELFLTAVYDMSVFNPAREIPQGTIWTEAMKDALSLMMACDKVLFLNGWEQSTGACLEYELAKMLDYEIYFEKDLIGK